MPNLFIDNDSRIEENIIYFSKQESNHINVLRYREGEVLTAADGKGNFYEVVLINRDKRDSQGKIISRNFKERDNSLSLAFGLCKNSAAEEIIEKSCEFGIASVIIFESHYSVSRLKNKDVEKKLHRWNKISQSALKQSENRYLTEIIYMNNLEEVLRISKRSKVLFSPEGNLFSDHIKERELKTDDILIMGPEGGFSKEEILLYRRMCGNEPAFLGNRIFRAETASSVILSVYFRELGLI